MPSSLLLHLFTGASEKAHKLDSLDQEGRLFLGRKGPTPTGCKTRSDCLLARVLGFLFLLTMIMINCFGSGIM